MVITPEGQVTIPKPIRERLGLLPNTEVDLVVEGNSVRIVKVEATQQTRGQGIVARLRGCATTSMSTDEIMALTRNA